MNGLEQVRPESPGSSHLSMKSDHSRDYPPVFSQEPGRSQRTRQQHRLRAESPESSSLSMKSDHSRDYPPVFSHEPGPSQRRHPEHRLRAESPESSHLSMKSDHSRDCPPVFSHEPGPSQRRRQQHRLRAESPQSSHLSMKSDRSRDYPPVFSHEPGPSQRRRQQHRHKAESPESSCLSMKSDHSRDYPPVFSQEPGPSQRRVSSVKKNPEPELQAASESSCVQNAALQEVSNRLKNILRRRCEHVIEGTDRTGSGTLLNRIYTELYITEGQREYIHTQHEVRQVDRASKKMIVPETPIRCQDIFKALPDQQRPIRVVLTYGIAGIGKTFSVQKFTLDWAEGLENQDLSLVILLSFRELNLIRDQQYSLLQLLHVFEPTLQKVPAETLTVCNLLFIFDGLDESRLSLDFTNRKFVSDVTQKSSIRELVANLIDGNLLPSALIWITTRPAAANQIPPTCVDRVTEVRGFTDAQKEEYFRRRFSDEELSNKIISHMKTSRSLYVMCRIPVFCWITATVVEHMLTTEQTGKLPKTLTDMYSHFLLVQIKKKENKYHEGHETSQQELSETDREVLLKLGRLAFEHLEKGNILFYQEDLEQCGLDVTEASVYSGVCTEIFKQECVSFKKSVYSFVHLSIQEFLAAVYMFHCYSNRKMEVLQTFLSKEISSLDEFLKTAMEKSSPFENPHLELFVRFLHGLCLESNQKLLRGLLGQTEISPEMIQKVIKNLKEINAVSPDKNINCFHCMMEMNDLSVYQEIQEFLKSGNKSGMKLSGIQCSALAYMLLMSEEVLDEFDLGEYNTSKEVRHRLLPAVMNCRKARFHDVLEIFCKYATITLNSTPCHLRELHLSSMPLEDNAVELFGTLMSPYCKLQKLRLENCSLSQTCSAALVSVLKSNQSSLKHLGLIINNLQEPGVKELCSFLESPLCKLETVSIQDCSLPEESPGRYWSRV